MIFHLLENCASTFDIIQDVSHVSDGAVIVILTVSISIWPLCGSTDVCEMFEEKKCQPDCLCCE